MIQGINYTIGNQKYFKKFNDFIRFQKPWDVGRIHDILSSGSLFVPFNGKLTCLGLGKFDFIPKFRTVIYDCQYDEFSL